MAKNIPSIFHVKGTIMGFTFVESKAGSQYVRAARGTYKKAKCNKALTANYKRTAFINATAKKVYDVLKIFSGNFRGYKLWQEMLKRFLKSASDEIPSLVTGLKNLEINKTYSFERLVPVPAITIHCTKQRLRATLAPDNHPIFGKDRTEADCYYYELMVIFFDGKGNPVYDSAWSEWIKLNENLPAGYEFLFNRPAKTVCWLLCLKLEAGLQEQVVGLFWGKGMRIIESGI